MKKIIASVAALALAASAVSALSTGASAIGADKIDFEDGDFSFAYLNTDDSDCVASGLEIVDHNGSKQLSLKVTHDVKPKVWFDLDSIMPRESALNIASIKMDVQSAPMDAEGVIGWKGGALGAAGGFDREKMSGAELQKNPDWSMGNQFEICAYNPGEESPVATAEIKFLLPKSKYTMEGTNPFLGLQVWKDDPSDENSGPNDYILYMDNIVFLDKDGNAIPLGVSAPAAAEEVAEPEAEAVEEEAPAEDEIVLEEPEFEPESDDEPIAVEEAAPVVEEAAPAVEAAPAAVPATSNTNTGNASAAAVVSVMALAAAAMAISKRK
ncbi:MAG: hypothetical protein IKR73_08805 [Oscillospiraceae bacterium]|nr:hypothetical protein [Oscillospiraceae bacterium]